MGVDDKTPIQKIADELRSLADSLERIGEVPANCRITQIKKCERCDGTGMIRGEDTTPESFYLHYPLLRCPDCDKGYTRSSNDRSTT